MNKQYKTKSLISELADVDVKNGIVTGYYSAFNNIDHDGDMIVQGAFAKTIAERGPQGSNQILHLLQHNWQKVLGKPQLLQERDKGLYFETKIVTTTLGTDTLKLYEAEVYNEHSIGFRTMKWEKVEEGNDWYYKLLELKLYEGSTVALGANQETPFTGFKSAEEKLSALDKTNKRFDKLIKARELRDLTDETYIQIEIELEQIKAAYNSLVKVEPAQATPSQEPNRTSIDVDAFAKKLNQLTL